MSRYDKLPINIKSRRMLFLRNQQCMVHSLPLQAVTTDNDSDGSTPSGPSSSVEYADVFQSERGAQWSLLYCVRVWYTNAKSQKVPTSIKHVLEKSKIDLRTVDRGLILQQIKSSKLMTIAIHPWENLQPWVKWPISIFAPWFLLVSLVYGTSASMDLLPLWIIGPLLTGLTMRSSLQLCESYKKWVVHRKMVEAFLYVRDGLMTGQLPRRTVEYLVTSLMELIAHSTRKKEECKEFFQSGRHLEVVRVFMNKKMLEVQEACIDKYEDWRLVYLYWERKLKNIV
ncbi:hypothetical protein KP509_11G077100 [Ceratopteris richardii]|uniref:Uncharacterized protein n=1 Tax=Ceratopteris richardii TaxID=49495 RepID=A0A8T2TX44_CERRI|nr:hypothetical protein KP509_11G077100 [Ceratopteris richardii]